MPTSWIRTVRVIAVLVGMAGCGGGGHFPHLWGKPPLSMLDDPSLGFENAVSDLARGHRVIATCLGTARAVPALRPEIGRRRDQRDAARLVIERDASRLTHLAGRTATPALIELKNFHGPRCAPGRPRTPLR